MQYDPEAIQGNIIQPFGARRGVYLFLRFGERGSARARLSRVLPDYVTSAARQEILDRDRQQQNPVYGAFGLSWKGCQFLGLADYLPESHPNDLAWFQAGADGVSDRAGYRLNWEPELDHWEPQYRENDIHAVVILAGDDSDAVQERARELKRGLNGVAQVIAHEDTFRGIRRLHESDEPAEHFGHRDGITKNPHPEVALVDERPLDLPNAKRTQGSFLAILKLEQNPYKFRTDAQDLAAQISDTCGNRAMTWRDAQALAVGRRLDGEPLIPRPAPQLQINADGSPYDHLRDFRFDGDPTGAECPFHSHVRKMNPRNPAVAGAASRIVRRGMSYGPERQDLTGEFDQLPPSGGVGLMFTSYQANIMSVLTLLHIANDPKNLDATIGRSHPKMKTQPQRWTGGGCEVKKLMSDFVTPRGGGYFFAPSMPALLNIDRL